MEDNGVQDVNGAEQNESQTDTQAASVPEQPVKKKNFIARHKKLILILVPIILVIAGGSAGATYLLTKKSAPADSSTDSSAETKETPVEVKTSTIASEYTWLDPLQKIDPLPLFVKLDEFFQYGGQEYITYYHAGDGADGSKVYIVALPAELGGQPHLVITAKENTYSIIKKHSNAYIYSDKEGEAPRYRGPELAPNVTMDEQSSIKDLDLPEEVTFNKQKYSVGSNPSYGTALNLLTEAYQSNEYVTYQEAGNIDQGKVIERISVDETDYRVSSYTLKLRGPFDVQMSIKGELSTQEIDPIIWDDGSSNTVDYTSASRGCGIGSNLEIAKFGKEAFVQIGKSKGGQIIYGFADQNNSLLAKHYSEYKQDSDSISSADWGPDYDKSNFGLSLADYIKRRPLYIVEDGSGRMLVFSRGDMVLRGGCAKPVVYLYPTSATLVDVLVDADVTVSDPLYNDGWKGVLAQPNGQLTYSSQQYDSLFWEGFARREYPEIKQGFVVKRQDTIKTMYSHLSKLGLNQKESDDFVDFWISKVPDTPYVRLSWLGTADMNKLAPLYISPVPDTLIRVFLDMEGLNGPVYIQPQVLTALSRQGFTAVEWGGLVTDGSVPLLQ